MTRTFVAVFPPPGVQEALISTARKLPKNAFRLTTPGHVHLTLKFLGEVPPEDLPRVTSALERMDGHGGPFDAITSGFGVFPSARRARILWSGVGEGAEELRALARTVEDLLEPEGFDREGRPFVPHLTLGRARRPAPFDPAGMDLPGFRFAVKKVDLVQSKNEAGGVAYSILAGYPLDDEQGAGG